MILNEHFSILTGVNCSIVGGMLDVFSNGILERYKMDDIYLYQLVLL